jgi:uncharacterized membrane protein
MRPHSRLLHALALAAHLALVVLLIAGARGSLALLAALLLLAPLPGLAAGRPYTFAWASMLLAIYAALLAAEGWADPARQRWAFGLGGLASLEFAALILFVRLRAREARAAAAP